MIYLSCSSRGGNAFRCPFDLPRIYADGDGQGFVSSTYSSLSVSEFTPERVLFWVSRHDKQQKLGERQSRSDRIGFVSLALGSYYNIMFSFRVHLTLYRLCRPRLGETGAGPFPDTVLPSGRLSGKLLFIINKARLGGEETGPSSAFIHLSHTVAGGLVGEGG